MTSASGSVPPMRVVDITLPSTVVYGQNTVASAGTAEPLGSSTALYSGVRIKALAGNTGDIYVGDASVSSSNGFVLDGGDEVFVEANNLASIYIDAGTTNDGVSYIGS